MDSVIEKLPKPIRTAIRPDRFEPPKNGEPLIKDALDYRPPAANREYYQGESLDLTKKDLVDVMATPFSMTLIDVAAHIATGTKYPGAAEFFLGNVANSFGLVFVNGFITSNRDFWSEFNPHRENYLRAQANTSYSKEGAQADRFVYSGKRPLKVGNTELQQGDNYIYLRLPELDRTDVKGTLPPEVLAKWFEIIQDRLDRLNNPNTSGLPNAAFKAVVLELPQIPLLTKSKDEQLTTRGEVMKGKKTPIKDRDKPVMVMSREDFEALNIAPSKVILEAAKELGDPKLNHLLTLGMWDDARGRYLGRHPVALRKMIFTRANQILRQEVEANFNGPERINNRDENWNPIRQKLHPLSQLVQTTSGYSFRQTFGLTGEVRTTPLQRLLKINEDLPSAIKNPNKYKRAQMAFIIQQMIKAYDMQNIKIGTEKWRADYYQTPYRAVDVEYQKKDAFIDTEKEKKSVWKFQVGVHTRTFLTTAILYMGIRTAVFTGLQSLREYQAAHPNYAPSSERAVILRALPPQGLEWKLSGPNTSGYWVVATSHEFKDGGWKDNVKVVKSYALPESVDVDPDHIHAENTFALEQFGNTKIRIPKKPDTKAVAVSVKDMQDEQIKSYINEFEDGNIELVIPFSLTAGRAWANVDVTYAPSEKPTAHATAKIPKINTGKLNETAQKQVEYMDFVTHYNDNDPNKAVASMIAGEKKYSLDPPDQEGVNRLNAAREPEDYVNAQADLEYAICETANSLLALENAAVPDAPAINPAVGYMATNRVIGGASGNYLRTETWHRFNVSIQGSIVDATPFTSAGDPLTEQYIKMLYGDPNVKPDPNAKTQEDMWQERAQNIQNFSDKQKEKADLEKEIGLGVGALALGAATYKSARILAAWRKRRKAEAEWKSQNPISYEPPENPPVLPEYKESLFAGYTESDIAQSVNFFSWLSFGRRDVPANLKIPLRNAASAEDAFNQLKRNVNPFKVAQYLEDPKAYEKHYGLSESEAEQLRKVAAFLVG